LFALALVIDTTAMLVVPMSAGTVALATVQTQPTPPDWRVLHKLAHAVRDLVLVSWNVDLPPLQGKNGSSEHDGGVPQRSLLAGRSLPSIIAPIGNDSFGQPGVPPISPTGEHAHEMTAHERLRSTKLHDRTKERLTLDEVERIRLYDGQGGKEMTASASAGDSIKREVSRHRVTIAAAPREKTERAQMLIGQCRHAQ
jgi:hypothetical protein